jgi:hypothetical protein
MLFPKKTNDLRQEAFFGLLIIGFLCTVFAFVILLLTLYHKNENEHLLQITNYFLAGTFGAILTVRYVYNLNTLFFSISPSTEDALHYVATSLALPEGYSRAVTFLALLLMIHAIREEYNQKVSRYYRMSLHAVPD